MYHGLYYEFMVCEAAAGDIINSRRAQVLAGFRERGRDKTGPPRRYVATRQEV